MTETPSAIEKLDRNMAAARPTAGIEWHDPKDKPFRISGLPWFPVEHAWRRLPRNPPEPIRQELDSLANCPAGAQLAFRSDSRKVAVKVRLPGRSTMAHLTATAQCGFDLYFGEPGKQKFILTAKYKPDQDRYEVMLFDSPVKDTRAFTLDFPLYMGIKSVKLGLEKGASIAPPPPWSRKGRVVVYGTSATQGGCASRPGMAYPTILSRRLNTEFVNLGFSGNGMGDPEIARLMAGLNDPLLYVVDYEANCPDNEHYRRTLPQFIRILRKAHPATPILVMSVFSFSMLHYIPEMRRRRNEGLRVQERIVKQLQLAGDRNLHYFDGRKLLGRDFDECTVDGKHPTDLGFYRMANALEPVVRRLIKRTANTRK